LAISLSTHYPHFCRWVAQGGLLLASLVEGGLLDLERVGAACRGRDDLAGLVAEMHRILKAGASVQPSFPWARPSSTCSERASRCSP
jgi:hypothetical protein